MTCSRVLGARTTTSTSINSLRQTSCGGRHSRRAGTEWPTSPPDTSQLLEFASDASGGWGCGAWCQSQWWQFEWPAGCEHGIAFKEMFAVVLAVAVWGREWQGRLVQGHCDNQAVVHMVASRSSKHPYLMHLLRCLFFIEAHYRFSLSLVHIAGVANDLVDDLSRDNVPSFLSKDPQMQLSPTSIPHQLTELLLDTSATWTSYSWTQQFITIAASASPRLQPGFTGQP